MGPIIQPGTPLSLVVTNATGIASIPSIVLSEDEQGIRVLSEDRSVPNNALVVAVARDRWYARGAIANHGEGTASLALRGGWQRSADHRTEPRFPSHVPARILAPSVPRGRDAVIVDASPTGIAIEVGEPWLETRFLLSVKWLGRHCIFRCVLVRSETTRYGFVLHTKLVELGGLQQEVLGDIIGTSQASFEEAQRYLAVRANDPEKYRATASSSPGTSTRRCRPGDPQP